MTEYYVFNTQSIAQSACDYIDQKAGLPWIEYSESGKEIRTEHWDTPKQRVDGKWIVSRLSSIYSHLYTQDDVNYFNATFPYSLEVYTETWFSSGE